MNGIENISTEKLIELKNKLTELRTTEKPKKPSWGLGRGIPTGGFHEKMGKFVMGGIKKAQEYAHKPILMSEATGEVGRRPIDIILENIKKGAVGAALYPGEALERLLSKPPEQAPKVIGEELGGLAEMFRSTAEEYNFALNPLATKEQREYGQRKIAEQPLKIFFVRGIAGGLFKQGKSGYNWVKQRYGSKVADRVAETKTPEQAETIIKEGVGKPKLKPEPIAERGIPKKVQRIEESGIEPSLDKPQGLYTSRSDVVSPHKELGGKRIDYNVNPDANIFKLVATEESAGVSAFKKLGGEKELGVKIRSERGRTITDLVGKQELIDRVSQKYPEVDWSKYFDQQEILEGYAGLRAKEMGYDAIWSPDKKFIEFDEFVILKEKAIAEKPVAPIEKPAVGEKPPTELHSGLPVPQLIKNFYNEAIKPKISAPEGVEVSGMPQGLSLAHAFKLPQNVFAKHPIGKDIVFLLRQTERGLQYDTQININKLKPIGSLPKESRLKLGQAGRVKELTKEDLPKYTPKEQEAIIAHREMMDSYRKQLYDELKASGRPMPEKYTDWGLDEYMHHLFRGNWKIIDKGRITEGGFAVTYADAIKKVKAYIAENPTAKPSISFEHIFPKDALVYLTPKHRARLFAELAKKTELTWEEVRNAVAGKVVAMKPKKRYAGQTLHRKADLGGWAEDLYEVDRFYIASTERFLKWNKFRRESQKLYNKIPPEQDIIRREIKTLLDQSEAPPSVTELNIDAKLINNSLTRPFARPFFLRRAIGKVTNLEAVFKIGNPRFWVQNSTQTLTTVYPVVGERLYLKAVKDFFTPEGQRLLHENKVYPEKIVWTQKDIWDFRSRFTNGILKVGGEIEKYNHGIAFLSQYYRMLEKGAKPEIAIREALNFVDRTQFPSTIGNLPGVFRSLPIWTKPFTQFKPFAVRYLENTVIPRAIDLMKLKPAGFRFAGMWMLTGGLRLVTSPFAWATGIFGYKLYNEIKKKYGKKIADLIYYGIPGLLGADISGSLAINLMTGYGDIYSQIGQTALGPAGSDVVKAGKVVLGMEKPETLTEISPLIKAPVEIGKAIKGEELVGSAYTGRPQYRVSTPERLLRAVGIMPKGQTTQRLELQEAKKILRDYREKRTEIVQGVTKAILGGDEKALDKFINEAVKWNEKHPTIPIVFGAEQIKDEILKQHLTPMERMLYLDLSKKRSMGLQEEMGQ